MNNKNCSVVILNWNGSNMLRRFLPSVVENCPDCAEVIVADNGSSDGSVPMLKTDFPTVRLLQLPKNYGFAAGYNKAIEHVQTEYVVLLNSDVKTPNGWLEPLLAFMDSHSDVAACQPKILSCKENTRFEYAGAAGGFIDRFGYPYCRGRLFESIEKDNGQYNTPAEVHWATGACLLVRTKDYKEVGGLDGRFFAHNEEIDLCWRFRLSGKKVFCLPQSHVYHVGGGTLPHGNPRKTYLNFRNNLTMIYKNMASPQMEKALKMRRWLDWIAAVQSVFKNREFSDFYAIIKARRDFQAWMKDYAPIRAEIQRNRMIKHEEEVSQISILWQYFAKKHRRFSEIH